MDHLILHLINETGSSELMQTLKMFEKQFHILSENSFMFDEIEQQSLHLFLKMNFYGKEISQFIKFRDVSPLKQLLEQIDDGFYFWVLMICLNHFIFCRNIEEHLRIMFSSLKHKKLTFYETCEFISILLRTGYFEGAILSKYLQIFPYHLKTLKPDILAYQVFSNSKLEFHQNIELEQLMKNILSFKDR